MMTVRLSSKHAARVADTATAVPFDTRSEISDAESFLNMIAGDVVGEYNQRIRLDSTEVNLLQARLEKFTSDGLATQAL